MPNWCSNVIQISKDGYDFSSMVKRIPTEGLYGQFLPAPEGLDDRQLTDWCYENWGVKWDTQNADADIDGDTMTLSFDSPWGAPREWLSHMVSIGFDVQGAFWEPGMAMGGVYDSLSDGPLVAPTLQWEQDDCVERGSDMYHMLVGYQLISEEDEMIND